MKLTLRQLLPIFLISTSLIFTGCFEKKEEELPSTDSGDSGGGGTTPPSNNYGYVTLSYPSVSGTYTRSYINPTNFVSVSATTNIVSASLSNFTVTPSLPSGIFLNPSTGELHTDPNLGNAVAGLWKNQNYTITAQKPDNEGPVTAVINFGVSTDGTPVDNSMDHSDLRYTQKKITLVVAQAMTPIMPTYEGPQDISGSFAFSLNDYGMPSLSSVGLNFDNATGTISGTPTMAIAPSTYFISASNGELDAILTIEIIEGAPTNLHYADENATYPVGYAITANTPSASGGNISSYSVSPALPTGLTLDTTTGIITGTPSAIQTSAHYTITATNVAGNTTKQIAITVADSAPANLSYVSISSRYTVGASITANTPIVWGGGQPTSYSINPALPAGLDFDTTTGNITGMPTVMTAAASYTVTASNAVGSVNKVISVNVVNPGSHVLYAANGSSLKAYSVDDVTGEPIFVGNEIGSGVTSKLVFHPSSDCAFGYSGGSVSSFSIDKANNGKLTAVNSAGGLNGPLNMVMSTSGQFLFVVNNGNPTPQFISKFEVNPADCSLSNASSFDVEYSTVYTVKDLAISGNNLYANYTSGKIRHLKFDGTGTISFNADYASGGGFFLTAKPDGSHIYATGETTIKPYTVEMNGDLTPGNVFSDGGRLVPASVAPVMDAASNRFIYPMRNSASYGIEQVRFAADGGIDNRSFLFGSEIIQYYSLWSSVSAHTSTTGTYIYSTYTPSLGGNGPASVRIKIESNGALTPKGLGLVGNISGY